MSDTARGYSGHERRARVRVDSSAIDAARHRRSSDARTANAAGPNTADWARTNDQPDTANHTGTGQSCDLDTIFRQLIEDEIRSGRLTKARRKRIVGYAAQLRISAVHAGQLIESCRQKVLESNDATQQSHALRLVPSQPSLIPHVTLIWVVIVGALILDALVVGYLR